MLSLLLLSCGIAVQAQQTSVAAGASASGSGGNVSYSVGQVVYTTNNGTNGSVSQGIQKAYEIIPLGITEKNQSVLLTAYPNPTTNNLTLDIKDYKNEKLSYELIDYQGKILISKQISGKQTQVNTESLPSGVYIIKILDQKNSNFQIFKIIKN